MPDPSNPLSFIIYLDSVYILVCLTSMTTGFLVTVGDGWGKVIGSNRFEDKSTLMAFFLIEGVATFIATDKVEPYLSVLIANYPSWFVSTTVGITTIFAVWFFTAFDFDIEWKMVILGVIFTIGTAYLTLVGLLRL